MKVLILVTLLAAANGVLAQNLDAPTQMKLSPQQGPAGSMDAQETSMLVEETGSGQFRAWYAKQKHPAVVVYFHRELNDLPPGWEGSKRLLIEDTISDGKVEDKRTIIIGVEHNTRGQKRVRSQFAKLFEQSLGVELKKQSVRILDSAVLHRKLAAGRNARLTDIEYESLSRSARFVLEVELMVLNGDVEAVASLKDLHSGEVTASVRQKVESLEDTTVIDRVNRGLIKRLMQYKM